MTDYERYGVYYLPDEDALADFGAAWLGWDIARGRDAAHPDIPGLPADIATLTETPRRYGFHATLKPPFHLAEGEDDDSLDAAIAGLCRGLPPAQCDGLMLARLAGFVALVPAGEDTWINALAADVVRGLDEFRAPPSEAELTRRRKSRLSDRQAANLAAWGYPHVMDDFRFHMTLTGRLSDDDGAAVETTLRPLLAPLLPVPFRIEHLALVGEDADFRFHLIHRYELKG
ncbi:MAG: DUF1045 domain-containing protein [Rhodobacteraceae bacterium]|nr:DUF1045 domain-containing protein [Paracoccaceae bacterium]